MLGEFALRLRHLEKSLLQALNDAKGKILDDDRYINRFYILGTVSIYYVHGNCKPVLILFILFTHTLNFFYILFLSFAIFLLFTQCTLISACS